MRRSRIGLGILSQTVAENNPLFRDREGTPVPEFLYISMQNLLKSEMIPEGHRPLERKVGFIVEYIEKARR